MMRDSPVTSHARSPTLFFDDSNREDTLARNCANSDKMTVPVPRKRISIQKHTRITSEQILTTWEKKMTPDLTLLRRKRSLRSSRWRAIIQEFEINDCKGIRCEMMGQKEPKYKKMTHKI